MSKFKSIIKMPLTIGRKIYNKQPFEFGVKHGVFYFKRKSVTKFDVERESPDTEQKTYLVNVDGQHTEAFEVDKHGDDLTLEYDDKSCAITSLPLLVGKHQMYFTRDGFLGTMALNEDTLLAGDVYQPSVEDSQRKISKQIDFDKLDIDVEDIAVKEEKDHYIVEDSDIGDVATLHGSKQTLKEMNKAKRLRKLLKPSGLDKKQVIAFVGAGIAIGMYLYPNVMQ